MQSRIVNILFGNSSAGWVMGTQVPSQLGHFLPQWETEPHRLPTISQGIISLDAAGLSRLPHLRKDGSSLLDTVPKTSHQEFGAYSVLSRKHSLEGLKGRLSEVVRLCERLDNPVSYSRRLLSVNFRLDLHGLESGFMSESCGS
jgi:hypothetical protein